MNRGGVEISGQAGWGKSDSSGITGNSYSALWTFKHPEVSAVSEFNNPACIPVTAIGGHINPHTTADGFAFGEA